MRRVVYKYPLTQMMGGNYACMVPEGAVLRKIAYQDGKLTAWYQVDADKEPNVRRTFMKAATGFSEIPDDVVYIDTVFEGDFLVWHIYEVCR